MERPSTAAQEPPTPIEAGDDDNDVADVGEGPLPYELGVLADAMQGEPTFDQIATLRTVEHMYSPSAAKFLARRFGFSYDTTPYEAGGGWSHWILVMAKPGSETTLLKESDAAQAISQLVDASSEGDEDVRALKPGADLWGPLKAVHLMITNPFAKASPAAAWPAGSGLVRGTAQPAPSQEGTAESVVADTDEETALADRRAAILAKLDAMGPLPNGV